MLLLALARTFGPILMAQVQQPAECGGFWAIAWTPPSTPAILVNLGAVALQPKGLGEMEYGSEVVINRCALNQSHYWSHSCETAEPITA